MKAHEVQRFDDLKEPGDFIFTTRTGTGDTPAGMVMKCPCGCGDVSCVQFRGCGDVGDAEWDWNGSRERPSLTPSLMKTTACKWHGYLTDGIFKEC